MRLLLCLLAGLYASSVWGQEFGCGFGLGPEGASGASSHNLAYYQSGIIEPDRPPTITGEPAPKVAENTTRVGDYAARPGRRPDHVAALDRG